MLGLHSLSIAQFARVCVDAEDQKVFSIIVNQDTLKGSGDKLCLTGINVEILALELVSPGKKLKKLVYTQLGDSLYLSANFSTGLITENTQANKNIYRKELLYRSFHKIKNQAKEENILADKLENEEDLEKAKPRYTIDASAIMQSSNKPDEEVVAEEPKESAVINKVETAPVASTTDKGCSADLTSNELKSLKNLLKNTRAINVQMNITLSSLKERCLSVQQLNELFRLIEEDDLKVNLFKKLYPQISNPSKRELLYSAFLFESSVDEIKKYGRN